MTFIDFFAGVGGFRRGLELAGHKCVGFCEYDKFATASYISMHLLTEEQRESLGKLELKQRQKEILKDEYRNGEWYARDIRTVNAGDIPRADLWAFGFPCQDISVAGNMAGFSGNRSSLFFRVMQLVRDTAEEDRPKYLFIENVKNLLSINNGWDFAAVLYTLEECGYAAEWQVVNSKYFGVPQNRERVFIVGHIRNGSSPAVFPISGTTQKNSVEIKQIGQTNTDKRKNTNNFRTYDVEGIGPALNAGESTTVPHVSELFAIDKNVGGEETETIRCIPAEYNNGVITHKGVCSAIGIPINTETDGTARTIKAQYKNVSRANLVRPDSFGATGVALKINQETADGVPVIWYEKRQCYIAIRKLTPRECWRLQGWSDEYFNRAQFVNSDSQLYKQAGNGVTVTVIQAIAERLEE